MVHLILVVNMERYSTHNTWVTNQPNKILIYRLIENNSPNPKKIQFFLSKTYSSFHKDLAVVLRIQNVFQVSVNILLELAHGGMILTYIKQN